MIQKDIPKGIWIPLAVITLIVTGSVIVSITPESLSLECFTPDDKWYNSTGHLQVGYMVRCP